MDSESRKRLRTVAVVLAGGVGSRIGLSIPKQLIKIAGKPVIEHTIEALDRSTDIDEIIVMMTPGYLDPVLTLQRSGKYPKLTRVYEGGVTRNDTTKLAMAALGERELKVLFHDAVRPFLDSRIIHELVVGLDTADAVDTAIPSADTIIEVDDAGTIVDVPPRARLRRGQTPQAFLLSTIREAYARADLDPAFSATDDCTVVLRYKPDSPVQVVLGSDENMKVTEPIDIAIADKLFQLRSSTFTTFTDEEREERLAGKTLVIFGGSYGIGQELAKEAERFGATVFSFSRSGTKTFVQRRGDVRAALETAHSETGRIDFVVNTTGVLTISKLAEATEETIYSALDVNFLAPILIAQESLPYLKETRGSLLNYTSSSYTRGRANYSLYSSTKAAIVNFSQALADEWSQDGVRVNVVNPERTRTPMRVKAFGEEPDGTLLSAQSVALSSLDAMISHTTGLVVDVRLSDGAHSADQDE